MKKTLSSILVVVFLCTLVLSGCGSKTEPESSTPADSSAPADNTTATTEPSTPSGKISFMCWYNENQYAPLLDAFKAKYPDVEIDFQNTPTENNQFNQKLTLLANSGQLPDVFYCSLAIRQQAKYGYFADLTDLDAVKMLPDDFPGKTLSSYEGKVYSYAPDAWVGGIYYNADLFAENNLSEPKSWAEFLNVCKVFQDQGIKPISMASGELPDLVFLLHATEVVSKDPQSDLKINTGESTFSNEYLDVLNMWNNDCVKTGIITQDMAGMSDDQRMDEFATGQAAMTISGPWGVNIFKEKNPDLNFAIMAFPGTEEGNLWGIGCPNVGIAISSASENMEAAKALVNFIGSDEGLPIYQKITNNFLGVPGIEYTIDPILEPMKAYSESGKFDFPVANWDNSAVIAQMLEKGMQEIVLGTTTPETLVQDIDQKVADTIQQ